MLLTSTLGLDLAVGFLWGMLVGALSHWYLIWVIKKHAGEPPQKATMELVNAYFMRYVINIASLAVFYKHMWVLWGTGAGLVLMLLYTVITQAQEENKHSHISSRATKIRSKDAPRD